MDKLEQYLLLMRIDRPIGSFLLLWPTLWALWLAGNGRPDADVVLIFIIGVFVMRSAGCVINDYADRHIDPHVSRTSARPLATGRISPAEALGLFAILCLLALLLVMQLNNLTRWLSLIAVFLAASYPFMKRITHTPQFYLGLAFGWSVPMAYAAQSEALPASAWLLLVANIFWTVAYDTMYAMVDRDDDLVVGVKSTAILFGRHDRLVIGLLQLAALVVLYGVGRINGLGGYFNLGLAIAALFAVYQQWLIADREPQRCFHAFLNNNWFGMIIFTGLWLEYLP